MYTSLVFLCAEKVIIDRASNNSSIINILEQFNVVGFPIVVPSMSIFSLMERGGEDNEDTVITVALYMDGEELFKKPVEIHFAGNILTRVIIELQGVVFQKTGIATVKMYYDEQELGSYKMKINSSGPKEVVQIPSE